MSLGHAFQLKVSMIGLLLCSFWHDTAYPKVENTFAFASMTLQRNGFHHLSISDRENMRAIAMSTQNVDVTSERIDEYIEDHDTLVLKVTTETGCVSAQKFASATKDFVARAKLILCAASCWCNVCVTMRVHECESVVRE